MNRRHDLDWVRVGAFALLVLYHVGMYYVSWDWHVKSPHAGPALEPFLLLLAPWRLSLLFLVSGAATAFLLRRSAGGFLRERARRLLPPLLLGVSIVVPPQAYFEVVEKLGYGDGYAAFWLRYLRADGTFCRGGDCLILPTWNHLWFLAYLWTYTLALWTALALAPRAVESARTHLAGGLMGGGLLAWPIAFLALARMALVARFGSTHALVDDWYNHVQYLPCFALGFLLAPADAAWDRMRALRWTALALALPAWGYLAWYFGASGEASSPPEWMRLLQCIAWATNQWAAIVAVLGFARSFSPGDSAALRYLVPAVLPVYTLHQTVIVVAAHRLQALDLAPAVEGPLLVALTLATCFGAYEAIRRVGWLRVAFGLKPLSARRAALPSAAAGRSAG